VEIGGCPWIKKKSTPCPISVHNTFLYPLRNTFLPKTIPCLRPFLRFVKPLLMQENEILHFLIKRSSRATNITKDIGTNENYSNN